MTPTLSALISPSPSSTTPLPIVHEGRVVCTAEHVAMLLDSLLAGVPLPQAVAAALGYPDTVKGRREAGLAFAAACDACRALRDEAEAARRAGVAERVAAPVAAPPQVKATLTPRERAEAAMAEAVEKWGRDEGPTPKSEPLSRTSGLTAGGSGPLARGLPRPPPARSPASSTPPPPPAQSRFAEAMAASAAKGEDERRDAAPHRVPMPEHSDRWARALDEAATLGPGLMGCLLWVERRCVDGGLHKMDPAWMRHFDAFYASDAFLDVGRFGVRAAKSDSVCRALVAEVLMNQRRLDPSVKAFCPVMSANMREAGGRFDTIKAVLRACGHRDVGPRAEVEAWAFKTGGGGNTAQLIELQDSQGHEVKFVIQPANEAGAAGFTGIAGFGDELDLWGKFDGANPAEKVVRVLLSRYTTQPEAKLHLMSATYDRRSYHAKLIEDGDVPGTRIARIGREGSAKDFEERMRLAACIGSTDATLCGPPLSPDSTDIPCWVTNPITPIEAAYRLARGDLVAMFGLWGGRLAMAGGGSLTLDDARQIAEWNRNLRAPHDPRVMSPDGVFDYSGIPGSDAGPQRWRGL